MTIKQSNWAKGIEVTATSDCSSEVVCERFTFTVTGNLTSADIIELGVLPAGSTVVDAILHTGNLGAGVTVTSGIMSGMVGDKDAGRTCGAELFSAVANNAIVRPSTSSAFTIAPVNADRSLGVKVSGNVTAANQVVALSVFYKQ